MQVRVVTLRFDPVLEAFDDSPLQELLKGREVFTIRDHFFVRNGVPYLAVVVTCGLKPPVEEPKPLEKGRGREESWRALVSAEDLPLFNTLREWRAERARREGVPPYIVFTNRQLAAMVRLRPGSFSALGAIDGIGKAKLDNYGRELLALLSRPRGGPDSDRRESRGPADPDAGKTPGSPGGSDGKDG